MHFHTSFHAFPVGPALKNSKPIGHFHRKKRKVSKNLSKSGTNALPNLNVLQRQNSIYKFEPIDIPTNHFLRSILANPNIK